MPVRLPEGVLDHYDRFTLYNSPYTAHDTGCAIDLYPAMGAPSPVSGTVLDTRTVRAPPKPYAAPDDHLVLVEVDTPDSAAGLVARLMHVNPSVETGDRIEMGDDLGELVRAGFFAPWVDNHLHVGFRSPDVNPYRASGSLPLSVEVDPVPLPWDGTGTVVETGETYAILDTPTHPDPGETWVGIGARLDQTGAGTDATETGKTPVVLDGGLPHYDFGGQYGETGNKASASVTLLGARVGEARGRNVTWDDPVVLSNGQPITGISLFLARDAAFGAKLICPAHTFEIGDEVTVRIES